MWLSSGEWASVPLLDGVTAASRSKAPRRGRRRVTSAFTLGRISFEKSMKPLRGFFDLGLESFLALAAGLAMINLRAARRSARVARRVGSRARREVGCGARHAATARSGSNRSGGRARAARARKIQQAQSWDISSPRQRQAGAGRSGE